MYIVHIDAGAQLGNFERGGAGKFIIGRMRYVIHGLSLSVKCVAPTFRDVYLAKV